MDRVKSARHLRQVEETIAKSKRQIARQQEIITELEADGHDTRPTKRGLETLERTQRQDVYARETIRNELKSAD